MEPEQKSRRSNIADREKVKVNKKLLIYLFFLFISIALWYLNALSKDYTTVIYYKVRYENFPKGKALVSDMPEQLGLKVKGLGFSVLKHKVIAYTKTINLPIDNFRLDISRKNNQYSYFLLMRYTREWISGQLTSDIQLIDVLPDTLVFKFTDVVEKKVPIKPVLDLQFEKQFMQNGAITFTPDSVVVSGPQVMIDTLTCLYTSELKKKHVKDTLHVNVELPLVNRLTCQTKEVSVTVPVVKYTEMNIAVPIETINAPEGMRVRLFPGTINVSCWIGISAYEKVTPYMFRAIIDYSSLINSSQSKARIELLRTPPNAQNIRFYPKSVEYIIER